MNWDMFRAKQFHAPTPGAGLGGRLNIKIVFPGIEIPRLIFNMGIPKPVRQHRYTETAPKTSSQGRTECAWGENVFETCINISCNARSPTPMLLTIARRWASVFHYEFHCGEITWSRNIFLYIYARQPNCFPNNLFSLMIRKHLSSVLLARCEGNPFIGRFHWERASNAKCYLIIVRVIWVQLV